MSKSKPVIDESFRSDREWHYEVPDNSATLAEKLAYQRKLRAAWENADNPFDVMDIPLEDERWWTHPTNPSPEQIQQQIKRRMRRYLST